MSINNLSLDKNFMNSSRSAGRLLMCSPHHFEVKYVINQWMQPESWQEHKSEFKEIANEQWKHLYKTFESLGVGIDLIKQEAGVPDMVFTANAAIVLDDKVLLARFRYPQRQGEEKYFAKYFRHAQEQGILKDVAEFPTGIFQEGAGDCIWDSHRQLFWSGYGPRSDKEACKYIEEYFARKVIALELLSSRFYHLDLSLSPLKHGHVLYYPGAFSEDSQKIIKEHVSSDKLIELDKEDAFNFVCNLVNIEDKIVLSQCSDKLKRILEEKGYMVIDTPVDKFGLAGGSVCCLTLRLDRNSSK